MAFCGIEKNKFFKRICPVSINFGDTGDIYFVTADAVASILQGILSC